MDYIFINGRPFSLNKPVNINFHSIQACTGQGKVELKKGLYIVKKTYEYMGFGITQYHGDNEYDKIISDLFPSTLYVCSADEHIWVIERASCTVKERVRCSCRSTNYKRFTKITTKDINQDAIYCLNVPL